MSLPERVLDNAQVVRAIFHLTRIQREPYAVRLGTEHQSRVELFGANGLFKVPHVQFVGLSVNGWDTCVCVRRDCRLLVRVLSITEL